MPNNTNMKTLCESDDLYYSSELSRHKLRIELITPKSLAGTAVECY